MFFNLTEKRRSIRKYSPRPVEPEKIDLIMEAALRAPSSRSICPWEFIVITDSGILDKLSKSKPHGATFLKDAPLGIVVCADRLKCDVWIEDASIAATFIHLAATDLGLGSCWIQIRKRDHDKNITAGEFISDLLDLPDTLEILAIVAIGYPDEKKMPRSRDSLDFEKISYNMYGVKKSAGH
ncbi:MAG: nitroreductase family protein [Deltaproteobacteria bacterium]|nr:nitroreductase family protein [Deltaproteobacteria bacterium]